MGRYWDNHPDVRRKWFRDRYERNRQKLHEYKVAKGCADCGYKEHHAGLELDHLPEFEKHENVSALLGRGWNIVERELAKCEVVCGTCHGIRTWNRKQTALSSSG